MLEDYILKAVLMMKKVNDSIKSNTRQILEILILLVFVVIPWFVNLETAFKDYLQDNSLSPDNAVAYIVITQGKCVASVILLVFVIWRIREFNKDYVMNKMRVYHEYPFVWYWLCSKILGIRKCSLVLVPIYMQFKLVINGTFDEYPMGEDDYPAIDDEPKCVVTRINTEADSREINLIIEDTYLVEISQIPKEKRGFKTIKISRNDGSSNVRHFSQELIETTIDIVRGLNHDSVVNVYATTNPKNTIIIASNVFALGDRGNIKHLYVFQQKNGQVRAFKPKGYRIF